MNLSIPKDASDAPEDIPSEEDTSESFPNQEEDSETAALVTADPLTNLKADFESQLGSLKALFESQLDSTETAALVTADQLANLNADFESQKAVFASQLESQKADFESQLDNQNAVIKNLQKSDLFSLNRMSKSRLEEQGRKKLPPDTFSFLVCSNKWSQPFLLGISVFIFQIAIFSLLTADLINADFGEPNENPVAIPANVETSVTVTQFLAIIIAVMTQTDLRTSLEQANEGYSEERIGKEFGEATRGKWRFATACRFWNGALGLVVTFLLIVTADNVFDLLLNFTAIEFVSQLDDVAFFLAALGYFGSKSAEKSQEIEEKTYPQAADEKKRRRILHGLLLGVVFSGMLAGWGVIVNRQKSSKYLCEHFIIRSSQDAGSVNSSQTQLIDYGFYELSRGRNDERVHYIGPGRFRFGYCEQETAWTYFFYKETAYYRDYGCNDFVAKSAETTSFDIRTTLSFPWVSSNQVQLDPIQYFCLDGASLDLERNSFTGPLPTELGKLSELKHLSLNWNSFTGPLPTELGKLSELNLLSLDRNSFTGPLPTELGKLSELNYLYLGSNSFTGTLPTQLGKLSELERLQLDYNSFTGPLPTELGLLTELEFLSLHGNDLTGPIPSELGLLASLSYLDLVNNDLTGAIPSQLNRLTNTYINLWGNNFTNCAEFQAQHLYTASTVYCSCEDFKAQYSNVDC